ncbi:hypothetical protein L9F63_003343 [Diploptera punctata]|uniref:Uncharacterized protein n=1 Tax=Diploptera punctata TaxID=6984 RepID=A0AAD7ZL01_DIPPU|nr:hypothetical protein L9F63_003343 [Diploptera punctata]
MIIFRAYFICLVAIIPVFAALHVVDQPNHLLTRRDANSDLVNISTYVDQNLKIPKLLRVAKDLREDVKSDLKQFFSTKNLLSIAQKFIKIALKLIETLTGYVTSESVREAIQLLGFPGAESVAKFVELILQFVNELIKEISESDFIVGEPTTENFVKMLSDSVLLSLKKGLYLNAVIMESAKKAFAESNNVKYDVLDNIELSSQLAKEGFDIVHKYAKQIIQGIEKLTNNETME